MSNLHYKPPTPPQPCPFCGAEAERDARLDAWRIVHRKACYFARIMDGDAKGKCVTILWSLHDPLRRAWDRRRP